MSIKNQRIVLTGAMGGGKSTVLTVLAGLGLKCVPEPAREILAEQRLIEASGVPEKNAELFTMLMLSRAIQNYRQSDPDQGRVLFDRGIPDMIAYAKLFGFNPTPFRNAADQFRYNDLVFYFPPWEAIYANDEERRIGFDGAREFGIQTREIYRSLGYQVTDVPLESIAERARFIQETLKLI